MSNFKKIGTDAARLRLLNQRKRIREAVMKQVRLEEKQTQQQHQQHQLAKNNRESSTPRNLNIISVGALSAHERKKKELEQQARQEQHRINQLKQLEKLNEHRADTSKLRRMKQASMAAARKEFVQALQETEDLWQVHPSEAELRRYRLQEPKRVSFDNSTGEPVCKVGETLPVHVQAKIVTTISCRGVFLRVLGYEQVCFKKTNKPDAGNAIRKTLIDREVCVFGDSVPGEYTWPARWKLPEDLLSSFALDDLNEHTGVFYELSVRFDTISRLRSHPIPFHVEGKLDYSPLSQSASMVRQNAKHIISGGQITLTGSLKESMFVAGDRVPFHVRFENSSSKQVSDVKLTIKQQVSLVTAKGKRVTTSRRVFYGAFNECRAVKKGTFEHDYEIRLPKSLPSTQSTRFGLITIEYHVNIRLDLSWKRDLMVRLPILVIRATQFPGVDAPKPKTPRQRKATEDEASSSSLSSSAAAAATPERRPSGGGSPYLVPPGGGRRASEPVGSSSLSGGDVEQALTPAVDETAYDLAMQCFRKFDADHNGELDQAEFHTMYQELAQQKQLPAQDEQRAWAECDADGNGVISFNELVDWLLLNEQLPAPPSPRSSAQGGNSGGSGGNNGSYHHEPYPYMLTEKEKSQFRPALLWTHGDDVKEEIDSSFQSDPFPSPNPSPMPSPRINK